MLPSLQRIINMKSFFKVIDFSKNHFTYNFKMPSKILLQNIYINWLQSTCSKSSKQLPIILSKNIKEIQEVPFGVITPCSLDESDHVLHHGLSNYAPDIKRELLLNVYLPAQDVMQYFIQWQRYRKYWWSSITTTPSLFCINEMKYEDEKRAAVDIVAQFPWGQVVVETVTLNHRDNMRENCSCISCSTTLEGALFVLLLDGLNGHTEQYLRLHRKMAPYKISFALNYKDLEVKETMNELAILMYNNFDSNKISTWLPDFELSMESQIKDNLQMGVAYTAIISDDTLSNGIIHLLNSNTMLKEQMHVADINSYAALLFPK